MAATHTARITRLDARVSGLEDTLARIEAMLVAKVDADAPAKVTRKPAKARKTPAKKAPAKAPARTKALCKSTRPAFVKAAPWAQGMSTKAIAAMCVEDPSLVPAGFRIGEGYTALFSA